MGKTLLRAKWIAYPRLVGVNHFLSTSKRPTAMKGIMHYCQPVVIGQSMIAVFQCRIVIGFAHRRIVFFKCMVNSAAMWLF